MRYVKSVFKHYKPYMAQHSLHTDEPIKENTFIQRNFELLLPNHWNILRVDAGATKI
jgi:hypothetical protein